MIAGIRSAKVPFGWNVESYRLAYVWRKPFCQGPRPDGLVTIVQTPLRRSLAKLMKEMSDIVQQRRAHKFWGGFGFFRQLAALQGVLQLRDGFSAVLSGTSAHEEVHKPSGGVAYRIQAHGVFPLGMEELWERLGKHIQRGIAYHPAATESRSKTVSEL